MSNTHRTNAEWAKVAKLGDDARQLAGSAPDARSLVEALAGDGHPEDAVRLLAHLLPRREAVLWAWSCARRSAPADADPALTACLGATEKWIAQPTDDHRRAAMTAAQDARVGTPAGAAGLAAFLTGESLAPAGYPAVPPAEFLAAQAVAASVMLSAVSGAPRDTQAKYRDYLVRGFELAQRIQLWERISAPSGKEA
jgi:hypothetical protein